MNLEVFDDIPPFQQIIRLGMVPHFVKLLSCDNMDIIKGAADLLNFIVSQESRRGIDIMERAGVIPAIRDLLAKYNSAIPISVSTR